MCAVNINGSQDPYYRYTMPCISVKVEGTTKVNLTLNLPKLLLPFPCISVKVKGTAKVECHVRVANVLLKLNVVCVLLMCCLR